MGLLASAGGQNYLFWADLVSFLSSAFQDVYFWCNKLISYFNTPLIVLADYDSGITSWLFDALSWILTLFGVNILYLTPLDMMLGSFLPFVIVFIVFKFFKQ